jgi:phosphoglycerol transferase MdoB-like AlkP superfamily enzyme
MLPQQGEPLRLGGRLITFFIVALAALTVSVGVAIAVRALMHVVGAREADAIVAALFAMPAAWSVLAFILLIQDRRSRQWGTLLLWSVPGVVVLAAEFAA